MLKKVESGAPPPSPPIDTTTGPESVQGEPGTQPQGATNAELPNTAAAMSYDTGSQVSEHNLDGQMRAALLKSLIPGSGGPGGPGAPPPGTLYWGPGGAGAETAPANTELKEGSTGPAVEEAEKQINQWRADNERKPIKADGKFDSQTKAAVRDFQQAGGMKVSGKIDQNTRERLELENDSNFKALDDPTKKQIREQLNHAKDQATSDNIRTLAKDPDLSKLSPDLQQKAFKKLASNPTDAAYRRDIQNYVKDRATLEGNANFKALDPVTQKTIRETMEKNSERAGGGPRTNLIDLATDPNFGKLKRANQDLALKALANNNTSVSNLQNLKKMIASDSFQNKMDDSTKARTLNLAVNHAGNRTYVESLTKLASDPKFGALSLPDQIKTLKVFEKTTPDGRIALQKLLQRQINGVPVLTSRGVNTNSKTVLDQLERLTTTPLDARFVDRSVPPKPIKNDQVSEQLLQELSDPSLRIDQSTAGTCTCTSMSHRLATRNPSEYARIATDLAITGQSKLANGDTINVPGSSAWMPDTTTRSHTERLVQSALMDYARPGKGYVNHNNGADGVFGTADDGFVPDPSNPTQRNMEGWNDRPGSGLNSNEERRVLKGLYDRSYNFYTGSFANFKDDKKDITNKVRGELGAGRGPVNADLKWGNGGHAVEIYKIEGGRVYIRNPWGGNNVGLTGSFNGTAANNTPGGPLRKVEDGTKAEESMTIADFEKSVRGAYVRD